MKSRQGSLSKNLKGKEGVEKDSCDGTAANPELDLQFKCRTHQSFSSLMFAANTHYASELQALS